MTTQYHLSDSTQLTHDDLRIGAGNIWPDAAAEPGATPGPLRAGLWLSLRHRPELDRHERVSAGQTLDVGPYSVKVVAIEPDAVDLEIRMAS